MDSGRFSRMLPGTDAPGKAPFMVRDPEEKEVQGIDLWYCRRTYRAAGILTTVRGWYIIFRSVIELIKRFPFIVFQILKMRRGKTGNFFKLLREVLNAAVTHLICNLAETHLIVH